MSFVGQDKAGLVSRNVKILDKRTSVRLEKQMWIALKDIAKREKCTIHDVCSLVAMNKKPAISLTASIRIFIMMYFRAAATEEGHKKAGHGSFQNMLKRARTKSSPMAISSVDIKAVESSIYVACEMRGGFQKEPNYAHS